MNKKVGIIGLGRFGCFWGNILATNTVNQFSVFGYSRRQRTDLPSTITQIPLEEICKLPIIFLCVPMRSVPEMLKRIAPLLSKETTVVDTCSVKVKPVEWMLTFLPKNTPILATHPMFGPESGKNGLDNLALMMYGVRLPEPETEKWFQFFTALGLSVSIMTPEEHDEQAAFSQALTHLVGRTLNTLGVKECKIATRWYQDLLAICKQVGRDSQELFDDMQNLNPYAVSMRHSFELSYQKVLKELDENCFDPSK